MGWILIGRRQGRIPGWWTWCATVVALLSGSAAVAAPTVLDFEDIAAGTTITTQYGPRGVIFQQAFLDTDPAAHSGTRLLRTFPLTAEVFTPIPLVMTFTSAQTRVKLFAGSRVAPVNGTLKAFDAGGNVVAEDGPRVIAADVYNTVFEVTVATASITRTELVPETATNLGIDDLEFEGEPLPPPPPPPVVQITSPVSGSELDVSTIDIAGTVTGEGLLSPVTMTMTSLRPPEQSSAPPFTSALALTGSGTTRQFSLPGFGVVPLGPITITVEAENSGALKGAGSSTFTNLPVAIRNRFIGEGGAAALGDFRFGLFLDGCKVAVYEQGTISNDGTAVTRLIRGAILTKWLSIKGTFNETGFLGCPLGEEREGPGGSRFQDFQGGRIFSNLPGTAYVPAVFVDVIDTRAVELAGGPIVSVPTGDPVSSPSQQMQTWLFQQFIRPDRPDLRPSTLEIRGTPPRLWIERQSGILTPRMGTLWEDFPCSGNLGPCTVDPPPTEFPPIENAGDRFCGGEALRDSPRVAREWQHIQVDDYVGTPIFGVVTESALAGEDFSASHEWFYNCPFETVRIDCPSDWTLHVTPIGPHRGIGNFPSLFAAGNPTNVELEYERFYGEFVGWMGFPEPGDLIYAVGRWIIDCGHSTFKSELHPIYMYAKMKTVTSITDPFTGLVNDNPFGGQPATRADVWVNGWYPGGAPIEFDIYPPPRPSPDATLVVNKPVDADAAFFGVNIEWSLEPPGQANHVHIKFTAPFRENHVDVWGQVHWEINRGYEGQWFLHW
jgi:LGFP repeat